MIQLSDLYLTASGRIGRRAFLLGALPPVLVWTAFVVLAPTASGWVARPLAAALLYLAACLTAQRLHDLGRAGWWAGPLLLGVVGAWVWRDSPFGWAIGVLLVAPLLALSLRRGQPKFNRNGAETT